ncbi:MAG TPA: hypothetical protein VNZ22_09695, partial [Bacillota bacterium]|nr:hypothetical protein [Bacillota bacterium]
MKNWSCHKVGMKTGFESRWLSNPIPKQAGLIHFPFPPSDLFRISAFGFRGLFLLLFFLAGPAFAQGTDDKQSTFFMGRIKYSSNDGNDCGG